MKSLNNKLKRAMLALGVCGLTFSAGAAANSCPAPSSYGLVNEVSHADWLDSFGGVTLNKTLTLLNGFEDIRGATYDPQRGEVVFVGEGAVAEQIDMDDLVVAMQSVFAMQQDPGITFYTQDQARAFSTGLWDVTYFGATKNRSFGHILFDADYLLKKLSLGIDVDDNDQVEILTEKYSQQLAALNYESFAERMFKKSLRVRDYDDNALAIEFWFAPKTVTLARTAEDSTETAFVFREMSMEVFVKILNADGDEADPGTYNADILTEAQAFADNITDNYLAYAEIPAAVVGEESDFLVLKKLEHLGKITALVRWMRDSGIPVDMSFMRDYQPDESVPATPATVRMLKVCKDATTEGIASAGSGEYNWDWESLCTMQIQGGITYKLDDDVNPYAEGNELTAAEIADLAALSTNSSTSALFNGRSDNPQDLQQKFEWSPTGLSLSGTTDLKAVAQTLSRSAKDGNHNFTSVDLAFPNLAGQPLGFTRYYDSFSNVSSAFGPGWSELPFELQFVSGRTAFVETDQDGVPVRTVDANNPASIAFPQIMAVDRLSGKTVPFYPAGEYMTPTDTDLNLYSAYFQSDRSNDIIYEHSNGGRYLYEQRDVNGQVLKQVYFNELAYDGITLFNAIPVGVVTPTGSNGESVLLQYFYDDKNHLFAIEGHNGERINLDYVGDRISRVWYQSAAGLREVNYGYDNGRLDRVTKADSTIGYGYQDTDVTTGVVAVITDLKRGEPLVDMGADLESRIDKVLPEANQALSQSIDFDPLNGTTTTTDSLNRVTVVTRDSKQRLESVERTAKIKSSVDGSFVDATISTSNWYDDNNKEWAGPAHVFDVRNNKTEYTYDDLGRVASVTDALMRKTSIEYGVDVDDGLPVIVTTDAKNRESLRKFDQQGRLVKVYRRVVVANRTASVADADVTAFSYDVKPGFEAYTQVISYDPATGSLDSVTNSASALSDDYLWITADESVSVLARNEFGQVETVESAAGYQSVTKYDGLARKYSVQGPADVEAVQLAYYETGDKQDAVSKITTAVGTITKDYDVLNRKSSRTDARGVTTSNFYNQKNQLIRVVEVSPDSESVLTTRYFYDVFGKLDYKLLPNGSQVEYEYDGFDRVIAMHERDGADVTVTTVEPVVSLKPLEISDWSPTAEYEINATTTADGGVKYYLVSAPEGMTINTSTGAIGWEPTPSQNSDTPYKVVVQVVGSDGGVSDVEFKLNVGGTLADADLDKVPDLIDNCTNLSNGPDEGSNNQRDTDNDGIGNSCDADLNNDGVVNFSDMAILKSWYGTNDVDADIDGNGTVGVEDLNVLKQQFGAAPGPSAVAK